VALFFFHTASRFFPSAFEQAIAASAVHPTRIFVMSFFFFMRADVEFPRRVKFAIFFFPPDNARSALDSPRDVLFSFFQKSTEGIKRAFPLYLG